MPGWGEVSKRNMTQFQSSTVLPSGIEKTRYTHSRNKMASVLSARKHTHRPMEPEKSERLFLVRVVREGFVEPLIFELVLELGRIWTGGQ